MGVTHLSDILTRFVISRTSSFRVHLKTFKIFSVVLLVKVCLWECQFPISRHRVGIDTSHLNIICGGNVCPHIILEWEVSIPTL